MRKTLQIIGFIGLGLFSALFGLTYGVPDAVESSAKDFIKQQIEHEIRQKYHASKSSPLAEKAAAIAQGLSIEQKMIARDIKNGLPEKIAAVIASMCGYDCERKNALSQSITSGFLDRIANINIAKATLGDLVKNKYMKIVGQLRVDLRIFLGANAMMFLILLILAQINPKATIHLLLPGVFLLVATIVSSAIYLFGQDWFYTILYNDYMGWGYLVYLSVIFSFLMDIAFNKGLITRTVINAIGEVIGQTVSIACC